MTLSSSSTALQIASSGLSEPVSLEAGAAAVEAIGGSFSVLSTSDYFAWKPTTEAVELQTADARPTRKVRLLQVWRGVVIEEGVDSFIGITEDQTNPLYPREQVEIPFEELSDSDRKLVRVGALFEWTISLITEGGEKKRTSSVRLRRLPPITQDDLARAAARAQQLKQKLDAIGR